MPEEIVGKVSGASLLTELTWVIDDCFRLLQCDKLKYSPPFSFAFARWRIRVNPKYSYQKEKWISFALQRMDYFGSDLRVKFKFELRGRDGTTLKSSRGFMNFNYSYSEAQNFFHREEIMGIKNLFGTKGELTVFCELRLKNESGVKASTQTEEPLVGLKNAVQATTQTKLYSPSGDKLVQDFTELLKSGEGSDVTFKVQEKEFKAHRIVLAARTPVFSCMIRHQMAESTTGVVNIEDSEPDVFEDFLHYVYAGEMRDHSPDRTTCLYGLAEKYQVTELKAECAELMADFLSTETFCGVLTIALRHHDTELTDLATAFFLLNKREIFATVEWQDFVAQNPIEVNEFLLKSVLV